MKKLMTNILLLLSVLPGLAVASEDCMMVDFPDHVELVCTGDGVRISESDQNLLRNKLAPLPLANMNTSQSPPVEKSTPTPNSTAEPLKPEEMVIVPKSLQIRMDRAAQTMERMRLQKLQRNTDPSLPHIAPSP
ncbi:MAG: hypothetical protein HXX11_22855 [Desulfuromonadales bacterium]|nr:hypothetical protein [Desulfuromonadales bacterium]